MASNNKLEEINIKNCTFYYFDDMININNLDSKNTKTNIRSYKGIHISYIRYKASNGVNLYALFLIKLMDILKIIMEANTQH